MSPENPEQLLIALEPEAASIYCRKLRLHQLIDLSCKPPANGLAPDHTINSSFRQGERPWGTRSCWRVLAGSWNSRRWIRQGPTAGTYHWDLQHLLVMGGNRGRGAVPRE